MIIWRSTMEAEERNTPTGTELDTVRRQAVARTLRAWVVEHERLLVGGADEPAPDWLDRLTAEALGLLVRLQVCRGFDTNAVAQGLARSLEAFALHFEECAEWPDAAERELDSSRASTFRELMAVLGGTPVQETPAHRRN
jgi:hypothetical protein